ncbi:hypothetical protein ACUY29_01140 [Corynebacterium aurimucosum]
MKLGDLLGALARGMHVVSLCAGHTREEMLALGATPRMARQLEGLHRVYFGQTAFTAKQRRARETDHALDTLLQIERHVARVKKLTPSLGSASGIVLDPRGRDCARGEAKTLGT